VEVEGGYLRIRMVGGHGFSGNTDLVKRIGTGNK